MPHERLAHDPAHELASSGSVRTRRLAARVGRFSRATLIEWGVMAAIIALAATLDFWRLNLTGFGNLYYAAAVRSMAQSWHNFFFVSYDPGGFVSVDKPPLGFWIQTLSVKLLGFSGFALLLPEALAGVLSVVVLWRIVRRTFGAAAGVLAALALTLSPINIAANRDNILEPLLTLTLLLAAWAMSAAMERHALRWLLVSALLVGLGFNIKMLEAYLVVPALALVYLVGAPVSLRRRLAHLTLAGALMLAVSFAWVVAVDAVPASQRPYVGSTVTNSELDLALGYNGLGRLLGGRSSHSSHSAAQSQRSSARGGATLPGGIHVGSPVSGPNSGPTKGYPHPVPTIMHAEGHTGLVTPPSPVGAPGALRLFHPELGSQVGWLLPLALVGLALLASVSLWTLAVGGDTFGQRWEQWRRGARSQGALLWGGWLLIGGVCFSLARTINAYYVAILAPAICALAASAAVELWLAYRSSLRAPARRGGASWAWLLLPLALLLTIAQQRVYLSSDARWQPGLGVELLVGACALAALLFALRGWASLRPRAALRMLEGRVAGLLVTAVATLSLAITLIAPAGWTANSMTWGNAGGWPSAGPAFARAEPTWNPLVDTTMTRYLLTHRGEDRFIVGALNSYITAPIIVATGQPVLDMGGFNGADPILTAQVLAQLVAQDQVHLFLLPSSNVTAAQRLALFGSSTQPVHRGAAISLRLGDAGSAIKESVGGAVYTNSLTRWVSVHCTPIPPVQWSSATYAAHRLGAWEMFSCQS